MFLCLPATRFGAVCIAFGVGIAAESALAEPIAYAINSDSYSASIHDHLLRVDLATGQFEDIGSIVLGSQPTPFQDTEGLALDTANQLWAVDDATKTFFRIDRESRAASIVGGRFGNLGLPTGITAGLDLGLTFTCDGSALMSGEVSKTLYRIALDTGKATPVGGAGMLGYKITDLAVYGPALYGLGSEGDEGLYSIDPETGRATPIGDFAADLHFNDGGLGFDSQGQLWAIVETGGGSPSRIFRVDKFTGRETLVSTTTPGIESLALTPPQCSQSSEGTEPAKIPTSSAGGLWLLLLGIFLLGGLALRRLAVPG
ncbi:MAG: hypothetical protein AB7E72_07965 [Lysobacterales bacterium]